MWIYTINGRVGPVFVCNQMLEPARVPSPLRTVRDETQQCKKDRAVVHAASLNTTYPSVYVTTLPNLHHVLVFDGHTNEPRSSARCNDGIWQYHLDMLDCKLSLAASHVLLRHRAQEGVLLPSRPTTFA